MLRQVIRKNAVSVFALKVLYFHAKYLGMVFFTITDKGFLKFSKTSWIFSIVSLTMCSIGYMCVLTYAYRDVLETSNFIRGITYLQFSVKAVLTSVFIKFQLNQHHQFLEAANSTIKTFLRITVITKELKVLGREFYLIVLGLDLISMLVFLTDIPNLKHVLESSDPVFVVQNFLGYMLVFGTFILLDVVCVIFIIASRMYFSLGNHMVAFADRIRKFENSSKTSTQKKQLFDDFCVELDECSKIYSEIFKIINKFHAMLQLIILLNFNFTLICAIRGVHVCFIDYMKFGHIPWNILAQKTIQLVNLFILVLCVDLMIRRSKIPLNLDWESLGSKFHHKEWDKCVYQFLAQLRLEDLKIDVFGLFSLNHELCLKMSSMIVGYLTIMIQFSMMGYLSEES